jgi:hypothetical protein
MSRRAAGWILGLALAVLVAGLAWWWLNERGGRAGGRAGRGGAAEARQAVSFDLYFPAAGGVLRAEPRELQVTESPKDRARRLVEALLAGPKRPGLARPFPPEVRLASLQLVGGNTAYVDLHWAERAEPPAGGSTEEIQRVYSVVNSIGLNVPEIRSVALLWNGVQRVTFSGHLDMSQPLAPDRGLLAR